MIYPLSLVLAFSSVFLISLSVAIPAAESRKVRRSIKQLAAYDIERKIDEKDLTQPILDRVILPYARRFVDWIKRHSPAGATESMRERLTMAGAPRALDADSFASIKLAGVIVGALLSLVIWPLAGVSLARSMLVLILLSGLGFYLPNLWLYFEIAKRQRQIRLVLADTLDLLSIAIEAGLGFDSALTKVVQNIPGPLSEEFFRALQEIQMGISRRDALRNLGTRTKVEELHSFIMAIVQADVFGVSISRILKVQAREMRTRRLQHAEEIAVKAPVKMVFPLLMCIFPALFVVIVGPAVIRIIGALFGTAF
ncbi:MAG: type II secretion system F family protein [Actinobacteria bacterium]|nr:type II secretion system F family protein [Actinomycetota bacterium]